MGSTVSTRCTSRWSADPTFVLNEALCPWLVSALAVLLNTACVLAVIMTLCVPFETMAEFTNVRSLRLARVGVSVVVAVSVLVVRSVCPLMGLDLLASEVRSMKRLWVEKTCRLVGMMLFEERRMMLLTMTLLTGALPLLLLLCLILV